MPYTRNEFLDLRWNSIYEEYDSIDRYSLTINPTPNDANVILTAPNFTQHGNSIIVDNGTSVSYSVSRNLYITQSSNITVTANRIVSINLNLEQNSYIIKDIRNTTFQNNQTITSIDLKYKPWLNNSMQLAFDGCTNLTSVTNISNTITDMFGVFKNCSNLTTIPTIPNSVFDISNAFDGCTNLTGNIYINSNEIQYLDDCFTNTSLQKNVYIPFTYQNNVNTTTYTSFLEAGYDESGTQHGVYLKDLNQL